MSYIRIKLNAINKKFMTVVTVVVALIFLSGSAIAAYSSFSDQGTSSIAGEAGTMSFTVSKDSTSTFLYNSTDYLFPNQVRTFTTTITNTGTVPLKYFVNNQDAISASNLTSQLTAELKTGQTVLYNGVIGRVNTAGNLRTLEAGKSEVITWTITWPYVANVNSEYQQRSIFSSISFYAIQA